MFPVYRNLGTSSWNPQCLSRPVIGLLYLYPHLLLDRTTVPHFITFNWSIRLRFLGVYANELHGLPERMDENAVCAMSACAGTVRQGKRQWASINGRPCLTCTQWRHENNESAGQLATCPSTLVSNWTLHAAPWGLLRHPLAAYRDRTDNYSTRRSHHMKVSSWLPFKQSHQ
jgi:hypothetical protein